MQALLLLLLAADFSMAPPPSPWVGRETKATMPAHYQMAVEGGAVDVRLFVLHTDAAATLDQLTTRWRGRMETFVKEPQGRTVRKGTLGGKPCRTVDVRGVWEHGKIRVTWSVARHKGKVYVFWVQRTNAALEDDGYEKIRASLRLVGEDPAPAKPEPREVLPFDFWKLTCVKPAGMKRTKKLNPSEVANQCILRLDAAEKQTVCVIRVYAYRRDSKGYRSLDDLVDARLAHFTATYEKRTSPEPGRRWKIPLVRKARTLRLVGKRKTTEVTRWYLAECRNKVQYQVEAYAAGGGAEALYAARIDDFLKNFQPTRK